MTRLFIKFLIKLIKMYKYLISPILGNNCRYLPTCSDYFIDCLEYHGLFKGFYIGIKRLISCHPIKFLGGGEGYKPLKKQLWTQKI